MKILVFSDSHMNVDRMKEVVKNAKDVDLIIHLGDHTEDARELEKTTDIRMVIVRGNTDYTDDPEEIVLEENGYKLLLVHGHQYKIKKTLQHLYYRSKELGADIAMYGHSHIAANEEIGGVVFLNPGSIGLKRDQKYYTYGKIILKKKRLDIAICYMEEGW